jgi:hypothetical protein
MCSSLSVWSPNIDTSCVILIVSADFCMCTRKWVAFIVITHCAPCEVRNEFLYLMSSTFILQRDMILLGVLQNIVFFLQEVLEIYRYDQVWPSVACVDTYLVILNNHVYQPPTIRRGLSFMN